MILSPWFITRYINLPHAIPTAPQPHKYLIFECISLPILSQCFFNFFFSKAPTMNVHPSFQIHFLTSILATAISHTSPNISEILLHHTTSIYSQALMCMPNLRNYAKICDQNASQLFFRVKCWDAFLVLWNSSKVTTTSIMEFIYTLILSVISLEPPTTSLCFCFESTHNYSKDLSHKHKFKNLSVSLARRHQKTECCNFINTQF